MDPYDLVFCVIRPVLRDLGKWSALAERLVLGTAATESFCGNKLRQIGGGPGKGIYQMEPATEQSLWGHYLNRYPELAGKVNRWRAFHGNGYHDELEGNLYYATAMCRVAYLPAPPPIPDTLEGQGRYYKEFYNTVAGKSSVEKFCMDWYEFIGTRVF